jgi:uncharacterized membrane protein YeaQ/YmgE (transglycosylase-associated protein family)
MIGMNFLPFLTLLVAGLVAAGILHYVVRYRYLDGFDGFLAKWAVGWLGAWLGSPVLGHWPKGLQVENVYILPALIGAFAGAFLITLNAKATAKTLQGLKPTEEKASAPPPMSRAA